MYHDYDVGLVVSVQVSNKVRKCVKLCLIKREDLGMVHVVNVIPLDILEPNKCTVKTEVITNL